MVALQVCSVRLNSRAALSFGTVARVESKFAQVIRSICVLPNAGSRGLNAVIGCNSDHYSTQLGVAQFGRARRLGR